MSPFVCDFTVKQELAAAGVGTLGTSTRVLGLSSEVHGKALGWPSGGPQRARGGAEAGRARPLGRAVAPGRVHPP